MSRSEVTKNAIRYHVSALSKLFGIDPTIDSHMLDFVIKLETSISPLSSSQIHYQEIWQTLCDDISQAENLEQKYNELKLRNIRELDPTIRLFSRIKRHAKLKHILAQKIEDDFQNREKSPNITLAREGVDQLQQLIAESTTLTGSLIHSSVTDRTLRAALTPSSDGPMFVDTSSRCESRFGDTHSSIGRQHHAQRGTLHDSTLKDLRAVKGSVKPCLPLCDRPFLWNDYLPPEKGRFESYPSPPIDSFSNDIQEYAVIKDLLQLLQGNQGVYIKPLPSNAKTLGRSFHVDENMARTLVDTVNKILPIASNYSSISKFIEEKTRFTAGMVNQALADAMRRLMRDYFVLLCQLEHEFRMGRLGIARLQFTLRDTAAIFGLLARIATDIRTGNCRGGAVLSLLHDIARTVDGVPQLHDLRIYLLRSASVPFFTILQKWIYRGIIADPYHEFFISAGPLPAFLQTGNIAGSADLDRQAQDAVDWAYFWEQHYSVIPENLPRFLDAHLYKCLNSGKYLNVVQQCADAYELPTPENIEYDEDECRYRDQIDRAYSHASRLLMNLMLKDKELKQHLNSVKRYFLLDQADFIVHFMDAAASELCKPSTQVSLPRLGSLLELAIRTSTATADPFKDNLKVVIYNYDLITQILLVLQAGSGIDQEPDVPVEDSNLTGLEAFSVDYSVSWPISLVLNRQVMDRYQMLFRHMFYCKHVERRLCSSWVLGKMARKADCLTSTWYTTAFLLGQRMLTFIQHIQYYMAVEVIEPTWHQFFTQMDKVSNLDALLEAHLYCLDVCMDDCLLSSPDLLSLFGKLAVICVLFANFAQHVLSCSFGGLNDGDLMRELESQNPHSYLDRRAPSRSSFAASIVSGDTVLTKVTRDDFNQLGTSTAFAQSVTDFDRKFSSLLVEFISKLKHYAKERNKLTSLVSRLDFNDYYSTNPSPPLVSASIPTTDSQRSNSDAGSVKTKPRTRSLLTPVQAPTDADGDYI